MRSSKPFAGKFLPAVFCMLAMLLAACGGSSGNGSSTGAAKAPANKQIHVGALTGLTDIKTFDPAMPSDVYSTQAIECVFTGLVTLNDKLEVVDQLAASHSISPDGLTYTFKLHPNLKFSDGTPLTSADVVYSIDRALDPALKSPTSTLYLALIKDAEKRATGKIKTLMEDSLLTPDPDTVVMKTSQKAAYFLASLTLPNSYVVEKSMIQKYGNNFADHLAEGIGGAGPFKVSKYTHGKDIEFVPNPNYYGPKPQLSKFVIAFYQEVPTAYKAYISNQLASTIVPPAQLTQAKSLPNGQYQTYPTLATTYIAMNYLTPPLNNIKIRQAFELAINKDEISHTIWHDVYPPTNHIVPQGMPGYNPDLRGQLVSRAPAAIPHWPGSSCSKA
jgi:oligopeptide transport system substrate-binding protein